MPARQVEPPNFPAARFGQMQIAFLTTDIEGPTHRLLLLYIYTCYTLACIVRIRSTLTHTTASELAS